MNMKLSFFELGRVVSTIGVKVLCNDNEGFNNHLNESLQRHALGDWGEIDAEDAKLNNIALLNNEGRLLSVYICEGIKYWIITETDRSSTTILLPSEY